MKYCFVSCCFSHHTVHGEVLATEESVRQLVKHLGGTGEKRSPSPAPELHLSQKGSADFACKKDSKLLAKHTPILGGSIEQSKLRRGHVVLSNESAAPGEY